MNDAVAIVAGVERTEVGVARDDGPIAGSRGFEDRVIGGLAEVSLEDVHCIVADLGEIGGHAW